MLVGFSLLLIFVALPIWAALDAALKPDHTWAAAGQNKLVWVLLCLLLGLIGSLIYLAVVRPKLLAATR
jgi:hypothetical protein